MLPDIMIGLAVVAVIALIVYVAKHHTPTAVTNPKDILAVVTAGLEGQFATLREDFGTQLAGVPALVSSEVARLTHDLATAIARAESAEALLITERQAHERALAAVAARVAAAVTGSPELPPGTVSPDVAAAQAEDVAAVQALAAQIHPA